MHQYASWLVVRSRIHRVSSYPAANKRCGIRIVRRGVALRSSPPRYDEPSSWAAVAEGIPEVVTTNAYAAVGLGMLALLGGRVAIMSGAMLTLHFIRPVFFGRNLHTIEYPNGRVRSVTVRWVSDRQIRRQIAALNGVNFEEIKHMSLWLKDCFTEPLDNHETFHQLHDGSWVVWTSDLDNTIPLRGLTIDSLGSDEKRIAKVRMERVMKYVLSFERKPGFPSQEETERILTLVATKDPAINALHRTLSSEPYSFFRLASMRCDAEPSYDELDWEDVGSLIDFLNEISRPSYVHRCLTRDQSEKVMEHVFQGQVAPIILWRRFGSSKGSGFFKKRIEDFLSRRKERDAEAKS